MFRFVVELWIYSTTNRRLNIRAIVDNNSLLACNNNNNNNRPRMLLGENIKVMGEEKQNEDRWQSGRCSGWSRMKVLSG